MNSVDLAKFEEVYNKLKYWAVTKGYNFDETCWQYY